MKNYENDLAMSSWFTLCIVAALVLIGLFFMGSCMNKDMEKRNQWNKENPVEAAQKLCYSKVRGSRPACWSEADWIVYCERVQCKQ